MIEMAFVALAAGIITTLAGLGGGLLLLLAVAARHGPHFALAATTPALLLSNLHRVYLFRSQVDLRAARAFALGALPAAAIAGYFVIAMPGWFLQLVLVFATGVALLRLARPSLFRFGNRSLTSGGALVGALTATSGGAGLLTSPLMLGAGLSGPAYVSTVALAAVTLHLGRLLGYGTSGLITRESLAALSVLVPGLVLGNLVGKRLRLALSTRLETGLEVGVLSLCTLLALLGFGH